MAAFEWNDGTTKQLRNAFPAPGDRFMLWRPIPVVVGPVHAAMGSGRPYRYRHRTDWRVAATLSGITESQLDKAQQLLVHYANAGMVYILTEDIAGRNYESYMSVEDGPPMISDPDEEGLYTFSGVFLLSPAPATPPLCVYHNSI